MKNWISTLAIGSLASVAYAVCPSGPAPAQPPPPSQDSFYTPPSGWQSAAAGAILRNRPSPSIAYELNCNQNGTSVSAVNQLLFRTTDSFNQPAVAVVTVVTPNGLVAANSSRLLVYQPPMDSASDDCSPSYQWGFPQNQVQDINESGLEIGFEEKVLSFATSRGYYIAITDHETTKASFLSGVTEGKAVLDATDAVLHSTSITNVSSTADVILTGYSGGSFATEFAAELQDSYKPSLTPRIKSVVVGGLPANVTYAIGELNGSQFAGLIPNGFVGLANSNATFAAALDKALVNDATLKAQFYSVRNCSANFNFTNVDILGKYFQNGQAFVRGPDVQGIINSQGIMGRHGIPKQDLYFFQGCKDEVVGTQPAIDLVNQYCATGQVQLQFLTVANDSHALAALDGFDPLLGPVPGPATQHIINRFNGITSPKGCTIQNFC